MFDPTGKAAAAILAVLLVLLPVSCRDRADDLDLPAPFECDAGEGDWRSRVMAPGGPVVYPVKAAWIDPEGNTVELNPTDLGPEGSGILLNRGTLALDFGRNVAGFAELGIRDAGGLKFDLRFAEAQRFLWDLEVRPYEALTHLTIPPVWLPRYHLHELDGDHDLRDAVQVGSFRHVRMDVHRGWARLERFGVRFTSYRSTPDRLGGYFLCDEDLLSRIWYAGVYTLDLCTIRSDQGYSTANEIIGNGPWSVVDGGKRDRLIWTGDLFMGSRVDFVSRADHAPSIDSLDYLGSLADADGRLPGCSPVRAVGLGAYTFLEYNLFWILTAWDQYLYTGDLDKLTERYSVGRSVLGHLETMTDDG